MPIPFAVDAYIDVVARFRGREIQVQAIQPAQGSTLSGLAVSTATRDYIRVADDLPPVLRTHTILHELAHLWLGHRGTDTYEAGSVYDDPSPATPGARYDSAEERAAELLATAIAVKAGPPPRVPGGELPCDERLGGLAMLTGWRLYGHLRNDLQLLWQMLADAMPGIVLERRTRPVWTLSSYRSLYRTVVEIHDGLRLMRPHLDPAAFDDLRALAAAEGLDGAAADAAAMAGTLDAAVRSLGGAPLPRRGSPPIPASLVGEDVVTDAHRLRLLARAVKHWPVICPVRHGGGRPASSGGSLVPRAPEAATASTAGGRPSWARAYDYLLGGTHNTAADRALADELTTAQPLLPVIARANRAWLARVVRYLVDHGVHQFLDIGSGIPTVGHVHEIADQMAPGARVVYVDIDPTAVREGQQLLAGNDRAAMVLADLAQPDDLLTVLADGEYRRLLDPSKPVGLIMGGVLPFLGDDKAYPAVRRLRSWLPAGSYLAISHATPAIDAEAGDSDRRAVDHNRAAIGLRLRSPQQIARFFEDLSLEPHGLMPLTAWGPDPRTSMDEGPDRTGVLAAVGRKLRSG